MTKTKQRLLSLTLVIAMFFALAIPASARASDYIARAIVDVSSGGNGKIIILVDVMGKSKMQEIGATTITVHEKKQDGSYQPVYTYTKEKNPNLIGKNRNAYLNDKIATACKNKVSAGGGYRINKDTNKLIPTNKDGLK